MRLLAALVGVLVFMAIIIYASKSRERPRVSYEDYIAGYAEGCRGLVEFGMRDGPSENVFSDIKISTEPMTEAEFNCMVHDECEIEH